MRYKLCLIEKTLLYHKADNSVLISQYRFKIFRHKAIVKSFKYLFLHLKTNDTERILLNL